MENQEEINQNNENNENNEKENLENIIEQNEIKKELENEISAENNIELKEQNSLKDTNSLKMNLIELQKNIKEDASLKKICNLLIYKYYFFYSSY